MPKSKTHRGKKYHATTTYNRIVPPKPKWMRVTKLVGIIMLSILLLMAIAGMMIKQYNHFKFHK